tara:strand:+ start:260 stop:1030 length:771 start_codon:yes stop_codon:yes gene_type:complete
MINYRNVVVKIGSALLSNDNHNVDDFIENICKQIVVAKNKGTKFTIVTSGAISKGQEILQILDRPNDLEDLQALAAIGQQSLMRMYEGAFENYSCLTAQVLLTHDDMNDPNRFLNAKATITKIISQGVIPIINENDVVATEEIRLGDNDTLAAMVSNLVEADLLLILTNQKGYFNKNPDKHNDAKLIKKLNIKDLQDSDLSVNDKSKLGTGGFKTKLNAVKLTTSVNTTSIIASGYDDDVINKILNKKQVGTMFHV